MRNDFESNYLMHHGILGQKWGKKNGPPYPLGASDHSASEKKAGWKESLHKKHEQKKLAKEIKKATKKSYTTDDVQKAMGQYVRSRLTSEQKEKLISLKEQMDKDQQKATQEFSKVYNKEYEKRFKGRKPTDEEMDNLYYEIDDHLAASKADVKAHDSWEKYIQYSRSITDDLIGKYGDTSFSNINAAKYKHMINRVLDDVDKEKEYKKAFSEWNNAEAKWYWNRDDSKREQLGNKQKELGEKEAAFEEKLKSKGYTDSELRKMREDALKENSSYHKYEELSSKIRDSKDEIEDLERRIKETGWKPSGKNQVIYKGKSKNGGEIDLAYDDYINLKDDLDQQKEKLKKLQKEYKK